MLMPKRTKYRKQFRGKRRGMAMSGNSVSFGDYGLQSLSNAWIDARQIEAARRVMTRYARKGGRIWIRIFPDKPITARAAETRMGKGKGNIEGWVAVVKPGRIMFEVGGIPEDEVKEALNLASAKLPIKTKIVYSDRFKIT